MKQQILILTIMLIVTVLSIELIAAQTTIPPDVDTGVYAKVQQEHKNTRKFFSDEMTRQRTEMFKEWDDRANYYEDLFLSTITSLLWKLGLTIAAVVFFFFGFSRLMVTRLEKKKFEKFKKIVLSELRQELNLPQKTLSPVSHTVATRQQDGISITGQKLPPEAIKQQPQPPQQYSPLPPPMPIPSPPQPQPQQQPKKGFFERRKEKKNAIRVRALQKQIDKIKGKVNLPVPPSPQQPQQPVDMSYNFEVDY